MRTKQEIFGALDPHLGIDGFANLIDCPLDDLISMAENQSAIAIEGGYTIEATAFHSFLTGMEAGYKLGLKDGRGLA